MNDAPLSDLLRQDIINTDNQLMDFYDYIWKDCTDTGISKVAYILFYQGGFLDHGTHVPVKVSQLSAESEFNS